MCESTQFSVISAITCKRKDTQCIPYAGFYLKLDQDVFLFSPSMEVETQERKHRLGPICAKNSANSVSVHVTDCKS